MFDVLDDIYTTFVDFLENLGEVAIKFFAWVTFPIWILPFSIYRRKK